MLSQGLQGDLLSSKTAFTKQYSDANRFHSMSAAEDSFVLIAEVVPRGLVSSVFSLRQETTACVNFQFMDDTMP